MSNFWRLIRSGSLTGAENMARDEALLESVAAGDSGPVLRLYRWSPATVTLGYGQRGRTVVNLDACRGLGLDVVRRCTGGRAVLHDLEMTYAVISQEQNTVFPGGILNNYQVIARILQQTLVQLGLRVQLAAERSRGLDGDGAERSACFTAPGQFELLYDGRKLAGCAQKRFRNCFLQHGSIPLSLDLERLFMALNTNPAVPVTRGVRLLTDHVGWINRWRKDPVTLDQLEQQFVEQFSNLKQVAFIEDQLTAKELRRSVDLRERQYSNAEWNFRGLE